MYSLTYISTCKLHYNLNCSVSFDITFHMDMEMTLNITFSQWKG